MTFTLSKRDKCLLIGLFGGLFLVLAWLYVATPLQEKTAQLQTENVALKAKADLYQSINANLPVYEEEIKVMKNTIAEIGSHYPSYISREDEIMFLANMENNNSRDLAVENIVMSAVEEVTVNVATPAPVTTETDAQAQEAAAAVEVVPTGPEIHMYRQPVNYSFRCTYKGAKDMITHLYAQTDKKSIEGMTLAYDSTTGNLMGAVDLNQYYMIGTEKLYQPATIPAVPKGVRDVFHTVNGFAGVNAVLDEAEEAEEEE